MWTLSPAVRRGPCSSLTVPTSHGKAVASCCSHGCPLATADGATDVWPLGCCCWKLSARLAHPGRVRCWAAPVNSRRQTSTNHPQGFLGPRPPFLVSHPQPGRGGPALSAPSRPVGSEPNPQHDSRNRRFRLHVWGISVWTSGKRRQCRISRRGKGLGLQFL